jgi:hypothetical protein
MVSLGYNNGGSSPKRGMDYEKSLEFALLFLFKWTASWYVWMIVQGSRRLNNVMDLAAVYGLSSFSFTNIAISHIL